jgi:hypothetical protein
MAIDAGQCFHGVNLVLANVASGVSAGDELGPSATDGQLAGGSAGIDAITDEGGVAGLSSNESIDAGLAAIEVSGKMTYEAGETVSPGDLVGIDGGQLRATNTGDASTNAVGVVGRGGGEAAGEDYTAGEDAPVHLL